MELNLTARTAEEDLLQKLGDVVGVSELAYKCRDKAFSAPVLVAENAFVFFPWTNEAAAV